MKKTVFFLLLPFFIFFMACNNAEEKSTDTDSTVTFEKGTYAYDANFLKSNTTKIFELNDSSGAKVLLSPDYQGRVMTSTATGDTGISFGWLNYDLIAAKQKKKQFNPIGGEERFWLGPEGGQFSLYFKGGDSFNINHWQVPPAIDTDTYGVSQADDHHVTFLEKASLTNYSGRTFDLVIERTVSLLSKEDAAVKLQTSIPQNLHFVGYETDNKVTNAGSTDFNKDSGLVSIWLLGMFTPSSQTTVIIPFQPLPDARKYITDDYFGKIPPDRLKVKNDVLFFKCDGKYRSKIGLSPVIAKPLAASFDFERNILTVLIPQIIKGAPYVNSKWELQEDPYSGDVINSYNDGPLEDGTQMGPFYEIESSSPALNLKVNEMGEYRQSTCHFQGDYDSLKQLAKNLLNVDLDDLKNK